VAKKLIAVPTDVVVLPTPTPATAPANNNYARLVARAHYHRAKSCVSPQQRDAMNGIIARLAQLSPDTLPAATPRILAAAKVSAASRHGVLPSAQELWYVDAARILAPASTSAVPF